MVKLKNEVTGFIYDSCHGHVKNIFTKPQTQIDIDVINMFIDEDDVLFTDNEDINNPQYLLVMCAPKLLWFSG